MSGVRRSVRLKAAKVHTKATSFMSRVFNQLTDVVMPDATDEIIDELADTLDELTLELEHLVLEAGDAIDESFDALEQCFAPVVHQFSQMGVSVPREKLALLPESYAAAGFNKLTLQPNFS